jgi:hypothetical protein
MKYYLPALLLFFACQKSQTQTELPKEPEYDKVPQAISIQGSYIREASGIAFSHSQTSSLWVNQDSGNPPMLYLLLQDGSIQDSVSLMGATNRDWEDLAVAKGPVDGRSYLYIGEIGDNEAAYSEYIIYRFEEPLALAGTVSAYDQIRFVYEDGPRDAEAFLVDDNTKDIYIVTKREALSRVYKLSYPQSVSSINEAVFLFELAYSGVVSAAVSRDSKEMLVKTYTQVFHYSKSPTASIEETLKNVTPKVLGYQLEPQGEAITFGNDPNGFYTLSEEAMGITPVLYFYRKLNE